MSSICTGVDGRGPAFPYIVYGIMWHVYRLYVYLCFVLIIIFGKIYSFRVAFSYGLLLHWHTRYPAYVLIITQYSWEVDVRERERT